MMIKKVTQHRFFWLLLHLSTFCCSLNLRLLNDICRNRCIQVFLLVRIASKQKKMFIFWNTRKAKKYVFVTHKSFIWKEELLFLTWPQDVSACQTGFLLLNIVQQLCLVICWSTLHSGICSIKIVKVKQISVQLTCTSQTKVSNRSSHWVRLLFLLWKVLRRNKLLCTSGSSSTFTSYCLSYTILQLSALSEASIRKSVSLLFFM